MKQAVLQISYKDKYGKIHREAQGKFFYHGGNLKKPIYLADMTPAKWWRNYAGWSISKQILDAFSEAKTYPTIVYRDKIKNTIYTTNLTKFKQKGILVAYGSHAQYVLPIGNWKAHNLSLGNEPFNLPVLNISNWLKTDKASIGLNVNDFIWKDGIAIPKIDMSSGIQTALI